MSQPLRFPSRRIALALVAVLVPVASLGCYFVGSGVQWQDAYRAMGADEGAQGQDERLRLANAMVEGEAPAGMPIERRLRAQGTLARLRFEQFDADGMLQNDYQIRALVPPLPYFGAEAPKSEFGEIACPKECRDGLERTAARLIERSGKAGLPDEWVLRMPTGRTFDLGHRSIAIQDLEQERPRSLAYSRMRVTLMEACEARVRIGTVTHLEFYPNAIIPIPREFRDRKWIQLEGCKALLDVAPLEVLRKPPSETKPPPSLRASWSEPEVPWKGVRPTRSSGLGYVSLSVDDSWLDRHGRPLIFHLVRACRYHASTNSWIALPLPDRDSDIALPTESAEGQRRPQRVAFRFPPELALYWAEWEEIDRDDARLRSTHRALVPSGSVACQKSDLPAPMAGEVVACVPTSMVLETKLVPAPEEHCSALQPAAIAR